MLVLTLSTACHNPVNFDILILGPSIDYIEVIYFGSDSLAIFPYIAQTDTHRQTHRCG